jgi:hypothetical protein
LPENSPARKTCRTLEYWNTELYQPEEQHAGNAKGDDKSYSTLYERCFSTLQKPLSKWHSDFSIAKNEIKANFVAVNF